MEIQRIPENVIGPPPIARARLEEPGKFANLLDQHLEDEAAELARPRPVPETTRAKEPVETKVDRIAASDQRVADPDIIAADHEFVAGADCDAATIEGKQSSIQLRSSDGAQPEPDPSSTGQLVSAPPIATTSLPAAAPAVATPEPLDQVVLNAATLINADQRKVAPIVDGSSRADTAILLPDVKAVAPDNKHKEHPAQGLAGTGTEGVPSGMIPTSSTAAMTLIAAELIQDHSATEFGAPLERSAAKSGAISEPGAVDGLATTLSQSLTKPEIEPPAAIKVAPPQPDLAPRPARPSSEAGKQPRAAGSETAGRDPNQLGTPAHATMAARTPTATGQTTSTLAPAGEASWGGSPAFETQDSTTLPGWSLHLAQGAPAKRQEFLAVLRQQLMSLPTHEQISVQMQRALRDGAGRVTIQLHPAELGRIHVRMEIDEEKKVAATIIAERPATLDLLQRDARLLERALQEAGLKLDANGMSFGLARDQANQEGPAAGGSRGLPTAASDSQVLEAGDANEPALVDIASGLLNLRV